MNGRYGGGGGGAMRSRSPPRGGRGGFMGGGMMGGGGGYGGGGGAFGGYGGGPPMRKVRPEPFDTRLLILLFTLMPLIRRNTDYLKGSPSQPQYILSNTF